MRHDDTLIQLSDLVNRMLEHMSDEEVCTALGLEPVLVPCDEGDPDEGCYAEIPELLTPHAWCRVSWPDHVTTPRYNSDASYHGVQYQTEAEIPDDERCLMSHGRRD